MSKKTIKNDLALSLAETLNKKFKTEGQVAYFIGGEVTPTDVKEWISTSSPILDLAISNRPHGGIPVGRITELNGLEASGKSLIAGHILAETQRLGGVAVFIDTENALSQDFLEAIGVDVSKMLYVQLDTAESIFEAIEHIIGVAREANIDRLVTIVVDSFAGASTVAEMEGDYDKDGWATGKAIILSKGFRKITRLIGKERIAVLATNQLRDKLGVMFGDKFTTSGGKALGFHASVRIRLKLMGQIVKKVTGGKEVIGVKVNAQVIKNRVGPPFKIALFDVYFDRGIDDSEHWLQIFKDNDIVIRSNPGSKIINQSGEEIKFLNEEWSDVLKDVDLKEFLYGKLCDLLIMKYKSKDDGLDIEIPTITENEDDIEKKEDDIVEE